MRLLMLIILLLGFTTQAATPTVTDGTLDLRQWDFKQGTVRLDGLWHFQTGLAMSKGSHGKHWMSVPGYWGTNDSTGGERVASYHIKLILPDHAPELLAIRPIRPSNHCLRILLDGKEQGELGVFGTSALGAEPRFTSKPVFLPVSPGTHDLVIEAAFFHMRGKGIPRPLELGTAESVQTNETRIQGFNAFLAGSLFLLGLQFGVVWWNRRRHLSTGLFALICLFSLARHLVTTSCSIEEYLPWIDWEIHLRVEYLTFGTIILWIYWFTFDLYPKHLPRGILVFLQISAAAYTFFTLMAPPVLISASVWYYQIIHLLVIPVILTGLVRATLKRESGSGLYLAGFGILATAVVNDILYAMQIVHTGLWAPAGMLALVLALAIVTSKRTTSQSQSLIRSIEARSLDIASLWELNHLDFAGHHERVAILSEQLAKVIQLSPDLVDAIRRGAAIHDAAMAEIPMEILLKPSSLSGQERLELARHTQAKPLLIARDQTGADVDIVHSHHEHWDGSGYPDNLSGENIPLAARIVAIANIWDALTHDRPHRPALSLQDALDQMQRERGRSLDPKLLDIFLGQGIWKVTLKDGNLPRP
ncbi:MAG: hypothetical protein RL318_3070 [Fibrobacterota bacterium]|jgi:hypothetical protein